MLLDGLKSVNAVPPPLGRTSLNPPIDAAANTWTNIKPNLGSPLNLKGSAKGNFNTPLKGGGGGGGSAAAAAAAGGASAAAAASAAAGAGAAAGAVGAGAGAGASASAGASAGAGAIAGAAGGIGGAPFVVGAVGFGVGVGLGNTIYKEAENPDSIVFQGIDYVDRKLQGQPDFPKLKKQSKVRSSGGVTVQTEILPYQGGQVPAAQYVIEWKVFGLTWLVDSNNNRYERTTGIVGESSNNSAICYGPVGGISISKQPSPGGPFYDKVILKDDGGRRERVIYGQSYTEVRKVEIVNLYRVDGTSVADDVTQGGNPPPTAIGSSEPRTTITNTTNTTNTTIINNPQPFADPPPQSFPAPPAIKPAPNPNPNPSPNPNPNPNPISGPIVINKPNIAPGSYPAPAPSSPTTLGPTTRISSGTASGSSGPSGERLASPNAPAPFAEPPEPGKFTALPVPIPAPATAGSPSPTNNLNPVNNGQVVNAPETERQRQGLPVPESGGSCCALPAIQSGNNQILDRLNAVNNAGQDVALAEILTRLGPRVEGGLSGWLGRFSHSIKLDRVLNVLQLMLALHNAAMVSRSLVDSISYLIDSAGLAVGLKDEDDQPLNLTGIIGNSVSSFFEGILGAELYHGLSENWKKLSAIYTAAVNIYEMTLSSMAGLAEGLEIIGEYTGKVGNALKKGGAVLENAYQWMDENIQIKTGRLGAIQKVVDGLESAESITSNLTEATEEIREVQENVTVIKGEIKTIQDKKKELEEVKENSEKEGDTASTSPGISKSDLNKPEN